MDYNVHEAKANLSKLLELIQNGKRVYICKRNIRLAELKPVHPPAKKRKRKLGGYEGKIIVHESFLTPMSEEELREWDGPIFPERS